MGDTGKFPTYPASDTAKHRALTGAPVAVEGEHPAATLNIEPSKWADWIFKVLSALVLPLVLWGVHLQVSNAVMQSELNGLKEQFRQAGTRMEQLSRQHNQLVDAVQETTASMRELKVSVGFIRETIQEIRNGINRR